MKAGRNEKNTHVARHLRARLMTRRLCEAGDSASIEIDQSHRPQQQQHDQRDRDEQKKQTGKIDQKTLERDADKEMLQRDLTLRVLGGTQTAFRTTLHVNGGSRPVKGIVALNTVCVMRTTQASQETPAKSHEGQRREDKTRPVDIDVIVQ